MEDLNEVVVADVPVSASQTAEVSEADQLRRPHVEQVTQLMGSRGAAVAVGNVMMRVFN